MDVNKPTPKFERFECVVITGEAAHLRQFHGTHGTILWRDFVRGNPKRPDKWMYVIQISNTDVCRTASESDLECLGAFDPEENHFGRRAEISFDVVMKDDMPFVQGTFRRPGSFLQVAIFAKNDVPSLRYRPYQWESGITGVVFRVPRTLKLNREYAGWAMSRAFGYREWVEVAGPDSIVLR